MNLVRTIRCKINSHTNDLQNTVNIYRDVLSYFINTMYSEWNDISSCNNKEIIKAVENLTHTTKKNPSPKYDGFDLKFYKFPSYFRRAAIAEAFGILKSHHSNLENYYLKAEAFKKENKILQDKPPVLQNKHYAFPVFYKGNMSDNRTSSTIKLKVFKDNDWKWLTVTYKGKALDEMDDYEIGNPSLVKHEKKFSLHFPCKTKTILSKTKIKDQIIVAVDLGLTNSAVCSVMDAKGTVIERLYVNQSVEKDRMQTKLNKLKKVKRQSGTKNKHPNYWRKINGYQRFIVQDTVNQIVDFATQHNADVIIFEYLNKIKRGPIKERLQHWAYRDIQNRTINKAHSHGIRVNRVSARNTSKLAFDGSGVVKRNNKKDLCTFTTGKVYHSDLNAAYNIGARYFIRELIKSFSVKKRLLIEAKVPILTKRTSCTLDSLISLNKVI